MRATPLLMIICILAGCGRLAEVGKAPDFTPPGQSLEVQVMESASGYLPFADDGAPKAASLWTREPRSLLGDRRAREPGDILTVVIEIDDRAEISNSTKRSRSGSESLDIGALFGLPERAGRILPEGAGLDPAVKTDSSSSSSGDGSVRRKEKLTLRIAATVVRQLPNGVLEIAGSQEVRVNFEMRELLVTGFVRPEDISRKNEITYDKIASARISYGGRGQITDVQQPRYGQQIADIILPF
ncbi:flagellar L-ring protein precursor FlgH [Meinhardsimonia xiamenensis]|uniref:Flagellar L-ring protein n=1 Tax=Meinhardsimonia xiamenensis TaxID=990712 RepID=A0A1G9E9Z8_9RHOB|nr:flagellar basal body L-ring protein FlgH [Meinhardsimonia xiamenensis]PRX33866.1 flagellar L-ring protein precursor FlgH [Meinhardsimonia xiamenensis]SDK72921.1 flagellar L-ring protein precursor FlgH [Meinhardsimonia xiamenensis]